MIFSADDSCDVGEDTAPRLPGLRGARRAFSGRVKGLQMAISDAAENADHLVSPEEAIRVAMADNKQTRTGTRNRLPVSGNN
jgi:hypothetical protein